MVVYDWGSLNPAAAASVQVRQFGLPPVPPDQPPVPLEEIGASGASNDSSAASTAADPPLAADASLASESGGGTQAVTHIATPTRERTRISLPAQRPGGDAN